MGKLFAVKINLSYKCIWNIIDERIFSFLGVNSDLNRFVRLLFVPCQEVMTSMERVFME